MNHIDFSKNIKTTTAAIWQTRDTATNQFMPEFTIAENDIVCKSIPGTNGHG